jgi:hypothetical protein
VALIGECHNCAHPVEIGCHYCSFCGVYQGGPSEIILSRDSALTEPVTVSPGRGAPRRTYTLEFVSLLLFVAVFALAWLIWPTPYRYDHMREDDEDHPVRTNRVTGRVEILADNGWEPLGDSGQTIPPSFDLPTVDLSDLTGSSALQSGILRCNIYNGSHWSLNEITVLVEIKDKEGAAVFSRRYRMFGTSRPLSNTEFSSDTGITWEPGWTWTWSIVSASGQKVG